MSLYSCIKSKSKKVLFPIHFHRVFVQNLKFKKSHSMAHKSSKNDFCNVFYSVLILMLAVPGCVMMDDLLSLPNENINTLL